MTDEFYHKDIFGTVVNVNLGEVLEEDKPLPDKKARKIKSCKKLASLVKRGGSLYLPR